MGSKVREDTEKVNGNDMRDIHSEKGEFKMQRNFCDIDDYFDLDHKIGEMENCEEEDLEKGIPYGMFNERELDWDFNLSRTQLDNIEEEVPAKE